MGVFNTIGDLSMNSAGEAEIAWTGETPWHRLGTKLPEGASPEEMGEIAYNWTCEAVASQYEYGGKLITSDSRFHMVRTPLPGAKPTPHDGRSFGVMSGRYVRHQPRAILEFIARYVAVDPRFGMSVAGALDGGATVWAVAEFKEPQMIIGEPHKAYLFAATAFDGSMATLAQGTEVRTVCRNTLQQSIYSGAPSIRIPHNKDFAREDVQREAAEQLAAVAAGFQKYKALAEALVQVNMSGDMLGDFFKSLTVGKVKPDSKGQISGKSLNALEALFQAYAVTLNEGTDRNTGWSALNAVTRYVDHDRTARDTSGDGAAAAKMASAQLGSGADLKKEAVARLCEIAGIKLEDIGNAPEGPTRKRRAKATA